MPLSRRWGIAGLVGVWAATVLYVVATALPIREHLQSVSELGLRGGLQAATPVTSPYVAGAVDGRMWFRFAADVAEGRAIRVRHTNVDNAPEGREVHWSSGWTWTIAGAGLVAKALTGSSTIQGLESAAFWLSPIVLVVLIIGISGFFAGRRGWVAGALAGIALLGNTMFVENFYPTYLDHHGIIAAAILLLVAGMVFAGGGHWRDDREPLSLLPSSTADAHRAARASGIAGGVALWLSAASSVPVVGLLGVAGVATVVLSRRHSNLQFDPTVWRTWGRAGAITSLSFYILEYFPTHLGIRLEVNHPLYALAWFGGGELVTELTGRIRGSFGDARRGVELLVRPASMVALAPAVALLGGVDVFAMHDRFLKELHQGYLGEFAPGWPGIANAILDNVPLVAGIGILIAQRRRASPLLWLTTIVAFVTTAAGWIQYRWLDVASGPQIVLAVVAALHVATMRTPLYRLKLALGAYAIVFLPPIVSGVAGAREQAATPSVTSTEGMQMAYRDVAAAIRASQPEGPITVLSTPNVATRVAYFGQFSTVGTYYWENAAGLRANAAILSSQREDEAAALIRKHGITHLVLMSHDDFFLPFFRLLHPEVRDSGFDNSFGARLIRRGQAPRWLQWIPYRLPEDLGPLDTRVVMFKVAFDQSERDALVHSARAKMTLGEYRSADADIHRLIEMHPDEFMPRLLHGQSMFSRGIWDSAAVSAEAAIVRAPESERRRIGRTAGENLLGAGQTDHAIRVFQATLRLSFDPDIACSLAFTLSTTSRDSLRNGRAALDLAQRAVRADSSSERYQICLSTALAETGSFTAAIEAAERARAIALSRRNADAEFIASQLDSTFRAGKPWRN